MKTTIDKYYVVEENYEGCLELLSIALDTYEEALVFKDSEHNKYKHSTAFILYSIKEPKDCITCLYGAEDWISACDECDDEFGNWTKII